MATKTRRINEGTKTIEILITVIKDTEVELGKNHRINTKKTIKQGHHFIKLKKILKKKGEFGKFNKEHFPHLTPKTIQRYMKLAKHVDLTIYPVLTVLSQNQLKALIKLNGKTDVGEHLEENDFDLEFNKTNFTKSTDFKTQVAEFIKSKKGSKKKIAKPQKKERRIPIQSAVTIVCVWAEKQITKQVPLSTKVEKRLLELFDILSDLLALDDDE